MTGEGKKVYSVLGLHICTELTEYHTEYCMEKKEVCDLLALLACVAVRYYYDLVGMLLCSRFDFWWASAGWAGWWWLRWTFWLIDQPCGLPHRDTVEHSRVLIGHETGSGVFPVSIGVYDGYT